MCVQVEYEGTATRDGEKILDPPSSLKSCERPNLSNEEYDDRSKLERPFETVRVGSLGSMRPDLAAGWGRWRTRRRRTNSPDLPISREGIRRICFVSLVCGGSQGWTDFWEAADLFGKVFS